MKERNTFFLKSKYDTTRKKKIASNRNIKKDIETVLQLNNYPSAGSDNNRTIISYFNKNKNSLNNNEENKTKIKQVDSSHTLAISIRKLKKFYPNINDEIFNDNYTNGQIPARTEHIKIEPSDMKEYEIFEEKKEAEEDKTNKNKENKKENEIVIDMKTGVMGPTSHKINFREMMKARNKIKKNEKGEIEDGKKQNRKNLSVEPRKNKKKQEEEIANEEEEKEKEKKEKRIKVKSVEKNPEDNTQSLYVKLILARNRLSSKNVVTEENVFQNILDLIEEFNSIKDLPQEYTDEINNLLKKLEFPKHLIIDNDVQDYIPEDKFVPLIANPIPLDDIIKKLNITDG